MRWLLITNTDNRNPGDEWIRIGVQKLVREVDPAPEFILRNKEYVEHQNAECEFDRAIWCGSPLFWSHQAQGCWENHWWRAWMDGWLFKDPRKVLILGVGNALGETVADLEGYEDAIEFVRSKCWRLVTRQKISDDLRIPVSCCPSIFALAGEQGSGTTRICNLMPDGTHDGFLNPAECDAWHKVVSQVSDELRVNGFRFVCHKCDEGDFARSLGWKDEEIFHKPNTAEEYLPFYRKAECYVGNRVHGAMLTIGLRRPALLIGYDSRVQMVREAFGEVLLPSQWKAGYIEHWLSVAYRVYDWKPEWDRQLAWIREFAGP